MRTLCRSATFFGSNNILKFVKKYKIYLFFAMYLIGVSIFYWNFPMMFQVDADSYLQSSAAITGIIDISSYSSYRGIGMVAILAIGFKLFGVSAFSVQFVFYLLFLCYAVSMIFVFRGLGMLKTRYWCATFIVFALLTVTNPIITTYSHLCLSEFPAITMIAIYVAILISARQRTSFNITKKALLTSIFAVVLYTIKQVAFPLPLIILVAFELVDIIRNKKLKPLLTMAVAFTACMVSVLCYIKIWNSLPFLDSMEGNSVSSYAGSFIVDGLRYFSPEKRGEYDKKLTVSVMDNSYKQVEKTFSYTFKSGLTESLRYFGKCFSTSPERLLRGYYDNYSVICGVINVLPSVFGNRAHAPVSITRSYINGWENQAFLGTLCGGLQDNIEQYDYLSSEFLRTFQGNQSKFDLNKFYASPITKLGLLNIYNRYALFSYSFISFYSLAIFALTALWHFLQRKNKKHLLLLQVNMAFSLSIFTYILFLAITAQNIDRYGVTVLMLNNVVIFNTAWYAVHMAYKAVRKKLSAKKDEVSV